MTAARALRVLVRRDLPYAEGLALQQETLKFLRADPDAAETLIFAEHRPVVTLGRTGNPAHLRLSEAALAAQGVEFHRITRGGDITYHGPGQWTMYPILRLGTFCRDLHRYMHLLEEMVIRFLDGHGVRAGRRDINTGVWVGRNKLCAVGIACSAWISWHGCAVNIQPDLRNFTDLIMPCGISPADGGVTSLARETGKEYDMEAERERLTAAFTAVFPYTVIPAAE